jgi:hypothetical protein
MKIDVLFDALSAHYTLDNTKSAATRQKILNGPPGAFNPVEPGLI